MNEDRNPVCGVLLELRGAFVESALTSDQVDRAVAEELRLGIVDGKCAFLADSPQRRFA